MLLRKLVFAIVEEGLVFGLLLAGRLATAAPLAYVTNLDDNTVSIIDTSVDAVTGTIPAGQAPLGLAVAPDGGRLYVTGLFNQTVSVIDLTTQAVTATINLPEPLGDAAITPDGTRLYVIHRQLLSPASVAVISTSSNEVVHDIPVGLSGGLLVVAPDGSHVYVTNIGSNDISVIDTSSEQVVATIRDNGSGAFSNPLGIDISPDGARLYVSTISILHSNFFFVDARSDVADTFVPLGSAGGGVAVSPNGSIVYVGTQLGVSIFDAVHRSELSRIGLPTPVGSLAFHPDGTRVYAIREGGNDISVIDTASTSVTRLIPVGRSPAGIRIVHPKMPTQCESAPAFDSIDCRLDALIATVTGSADVGNLKTLLLDQLHRGKDREEQAQALATEDDRRAATAALQHALRRLISFEHRIESLTGRRQIGEASRTTLVQMVEPIEADLRTLLRSS
jgi:YVTN family beta-propeller protein